MAASSSYFTKINTSFNLQCPRFDSFTLQHVSRRDPFVSCSVTTEESPLRIGIVGLGAFGQFLANILSNMNLEATPIDTKGYETLMELTQNTVSHGSDLYDGLFLYNVNSDKQIKKLEEAFDSLKKDLFKKLRFSYGRRIQDTAAAEEEELRSPPSLE